MCIMRLFAWLKAKKPTVMTEPHASLYRRSGSILIESKSRNVDGIYEATPPFLRVPADSEPEDIGRAVLQALAESKEGIPNPWRDAEYRRRNRSGWWPLIEVAGVKSWRTFVKGAVHVSVLRTGNLVKFEPSRNLGPKEGFVPLANAPEPVADAANLFEIGQRALAALDLAK
jgi:hypothetical protein